MIFQFLLISDHFTFLLPTNKLNVFFKTGVILILILLYEHLPLAIKLLLQTYLLYFDLLLLFGRLDVLKRVDRLFI